jgi:hypothetical protein
LAMSACLLNYAIFSDFFRVFQVDNFNTMFW